MSKALFAQTTGHLRILPLGGCGEFGMNLTCYIYNGKLYVVDCGIMFPEPWRLGIEAYIPDVAFIFDEFPKVEAYVITHGHEDHIGALPFLYSRWPAPVYATPYTALLIRNKLARLGRDPDSIPIHLVKGGETAKVSEIQATYVSVNHSLPDAASVILEGPNFRVFHTGDFKVDVEPIYDKPIDTNLIKAHSDKGIDIMLVDSTNAYKAGRCPSEKSVIEPLKKVIKSASGMVFLTTFSSNLWRLMSVIEAARQLGKKVFIGGAGMETTLGLAQKAGLYTPPSGVLVKSEELSFLDRKKVVALVSGCQAEYRSATARIANNEHRDLRITPGDLYIFSSRTIPGNERAIFAAIDKIKHLGAEVITTREQPDIHVSGHAYQEDIQDLTSWVKPKHFLPVHGSYTHLKSNLSFANQQMPNTHAGFVEDGALWEWKGGDLHHLETYEVSLQFIDSETHIPLDFATMRTRHRVGELGGIWVAGIYDRKQKKWVKPPEIELCGIGLPAHLEPGSFFETAQRAAARAVPKEFKKNYEESDFREDIRIAVRRCVGGLLGKKPVVTSMVHLL